MRRPDGDTWTITREGIIYGTEWYDIREQNTGLTCPVCGKDVEATRENGGSIQLAPCREYVNWSVYTLHASVTGQWKFVKNDGGLTPVEKRRAAREQPFLTRSDRSCAAFAPDRSDGQYTIFTDLYNTKVTVRYSSLATRPAVWIFADNPDSNYGSGALHLCRAMAIEVRDALNRFIADEPDAELRCEYDVPKDLES